MNLEIDRSRLVSLLETFLVAHAPPGAESEVDSIVMEEMRPYASAMWQDASGSIVAHIKGESEEAPIAVTAHKDEIAMMVKRVEGDGRLRVRRLGGVHASACGEGPVEVLGRNGIVPGILSMGSKHVSKESPANDLREGKGPAWENVWVETKLTQEVLAQRGVQIGSKVVVSRHRKAPMHLEGHICGYNLDCRAGLAIMMEVARVLKERGPAQDVYLIASSEEEVGAQGAIYAVGQVPADTVIALEIGPVAEEYQTVNNEMPIVLYGDGSGVYTERVARRLEDLGRQLGFGTQPATVTSFGSDASLAKKAGAAARSACLCFPGENTHGYEISCVDGILNCARLLLSYLRNPE